MDWIDKLERRWGRFGIPHLVNGLLIGQLAAGAIMLFINRYFGYAIMLDRNALLHGQIWRLITFLFQPIWLGGALGILNLVFYYWIGNALTRVWGDFRTTVFIALGMLGAWAGCFITGYASPEAVFQSMLFAYAWMWPDQMVMLFGIIPFRMKYLGWIELAFWAYSFVMGTLATRVSLILGLAGFLVFFGRELLTWARDGIANQKRRRDWENRNR